MNLTHNDTVLVADRLYKALSHMVEVVNVKKIDPLAMFICIEQARAALELAEERGT